MLPKPNIFSLPQMASPVGIGIKACNSGNQCPSQKCDITKANEENSGMDDVNFFTGVIDFIIGLFK